MSICGRWRLQQEYRHKKDRARQEIEDSHSLFSKEGDQDLRKWAQGWGDTGLIFAVEVEIYESLGAVRGELEN